MPLPSWRVRGLVIFLLNVTIAPRLSAAPAEPALPPPPPPDKAAARVEAQRQQTLLRGQYAVMVTELGLTDEQQTKIAEIVKAAAVVQEAWMKEHGTQLEVANKSLQDARQQGDEEALAKARLEYRTLAEARQELTENTRDEVLLALTGEQRERWAGYVLYANQVAGPTRRAEPTAEQLAAAKALCTEAAKQLARYSINDPHAQEPIQQIKEKLLRDVTARVLTAEQRAKLATPEAPVRR